MPVPSTRAMTHPTHSDGLPVDDTGGHYALVARLVEHLQEHVQAQPDLPALAAREGLSEAHLQRVFAQWAGISPKRFLQYLTKEQAVAALREGASLAAACVAAGLSSPGRLHDLLVSCEALTPGQARAAGQGARITQGCGPTPFGQALVAWTERGIVHLEFLVDGTAEVLRRLQAKWPAASVSESHEAARLLLREVFANPLQPRGLHLALRGTNFQLKVWEAVMRVPPGHRVSYGQLAAMAGVPGAHRAVGTALGQNTVAYLVPCHRVIRENAQAGHYRWELQRKLAMLAWEASHRDARVEQSRTG